MDIQILIDCTSDRRYYRVNKSVARKLWKANELFVICACKLYPFGAWSCGLLVEPAVHEGYKGIVHCDFDEFVKGFEFYNCSYETGYYASFYVEDIKPYTEDAL